MSAWKSNRLDFAQSVEEQKFRRMICKFAFPDYNNQSIGAQMHNFVHSLTSTVLRHSTKPAGLTVLGSWWRGQLHWWLNDLCLVVTTAAFCSNWPLSAGSFSSQLNLVRDNAWVIWPLPSRRGSLRQASTEWEDYWERDCRGRRDCRGNKRALGG